jgi:tRNA modification GTPase
MQMSTIAAISTPPGEGGIAIIRVSGSESIAAVEAIFEPRRQGRRLRDLQGYQMMLGWIKDAQGEPIDECLVAVLRQPHSYTAEDTVEIHCHGGVLAARQCLQEVLNQGIREALPGEFTQQAFLNGRLDASQAEAVIEVIRARSTKALKLAVKQLSGFNSRYMKRMVDQLLQAGAIIEASIDFAEDVGEPDYEQVGALLSQVQNDIYRLLEAAKRAEIYRSGVKVVICGKPNVGKSSLLNWLIGRERAIVTEIPGTTRDVIEEFINLRGIPVRLIDTAGIRQTEDRVEAVGVQKAQQAINEADLAIFLLDVTSGLTAEDEEVHCNLSPSRTIILVNKDDLKGKKQIFGRLRADSPVYLLSWARCLRNRA